MKKIELRTFANLPQVKMLEMTEHREQCEVTDDHGEKVITDMLLLALSWYSLGVHRYFNEEPYHVDEIVTLVATSKRQAFIDDGRLQKPIDNFLGRVMPKHNDPEVYDLIKQLLYVWHNQSHNYLCVRSESGAVSARAVDILHVYQHPKIKALKEKVQTGRYPMADAAREFEEIMMTEPEFDKSVFGLLYRTRGVSSVQSFQLIIARGDVTDLNASILPNTVLNSYGDGITNLADSLADSKGAGFSLISNGGALRGSEWFHKKVHNLSQGVMGVGYKTDCGTRIGAIVKIVSKEFKKSLAGKYRILPDGSTVALHGEALNEIKTGEYITIRSVAWCNHGRTGIPCSICFGRMESALPYNPYTKHSAVPGLFYGSTMAEPIGQSILKTKHRIGSASSKPFVVSKQDSPYIKTDEQGDFIYFQKEMLDEHEPYLILDKETQQDISDFMFMESLDELDESRALRTYETIQLKVSVPNPMFPDIKGTHFPIIVTTVASRDARMTKPFIEHLLKQDKKEEGRAFKISLKGFNPEEPAFELPQVNEDLDAYRKRVENFFRFDEVKNRFDNIVTPEIHGEFMVGLWKVIDEKYSGANIIMHDIFLFSCMARDPGNLNYGLPNASDQRVFVPMHDTIIHGGVGNALLYGYQKESLVNEPYRYLIKNRRPGVLEAPMKPLVM